MLKNALLAIAIAMVIALSSTLVRVENQRYALSLGMCWHEKLPHADFECLEKVRTRTAWWWHIFYAVTD